ncbi:MAG: hypothetical protein KDD94_13870, partial [Calditrichaeota bacterium]|nr:hypothetical protein [Calditrichota bacterium]
MISEGFDILILSGLFLVLTWAEFRRPARKRLKIRILLNFLLCICFYFLIYPPHYSREYSSHSGLLLTDNFNQKTLDSLITIDPNLPIVSLRSKQRNYQTVTDISALQRQFPQIQKWSVLGNGLRETELAELSNRSLEFQLNQVPDGISQLFYPDYIEESTQFVLQGEFINDKLKATQLSLLFEDQAIDSVGLSPGLNSFHFMIGAKTAGRFNYKLVAADAGNNHVYSELLALPVYKRKSYSILILSNYPRFEERQLKNWLSEQQDKVSWRSKI